MGGRVFLLSTNLATEPYPVYPLGMAVVAGALARAGHEVRQFDLLARGGDRAALAAALAEFRPQVLCLAIRNIDTVDSFDPGRGFLAGVRDLIPWLRRQAPVPLVVGGSAFTLMPEAILDYLGADHGVAGEGEEALPRLIDGLLAGRAMPRLLRGAPLSGAEQGSPLLVPELLAFYGQESGMANLQTKRGCPYACAYCTYPLLEGDCFRVRPPAAVVADLRRMRAEHGVEKVFFTDSVFNDPAGHYLELAEELARSQTGVRWCAFFRPQGMGREELALLKRAGLTAMELGTDAASDATLAGLDKGFTFDEVMEVQRAADAERIPCAHFVMLGGPGETAATVEEGLDNLRRIEHGVVFGFSGIRILPRSPLHRRALSEGLVAPEDPLLEPVFYFAPGLDVAAMNLRVEADFAHRRDRIFPPCKGQEKMDVMKKFGFRGILWDHLVRFPREGARA